MAKIPSLTCPDDQPPIADPARVFTAWELAGDWWWVGHFVAVSPGGRVAWEQATATKGGLGRRILVSRLDGLRQINRYVPHKAEFLLRPV